METMRAIRIHSYDGPDVLAYDTIPVPTIANDEVLVRIHTAGINPVDWKVREGQLEELLQHKLPLTIGWDFSGVIEKVGSDVTNLKVGDAVYSRPNIGRDGAYADYIAVQAHEVALKPKTIDHVHAAAVPLAALTAWQVLFEAGNLTAGQTVLIHAAAGGVGTFAVQLAKWKGAKVIGTASPHNHEYLRTLGADQLIDYNKQRFEDVVSDVDMVFDTVGGETQDRSWQVLKKDGVLASIVRGTKIHDTAAEHNARGEFVFVQPNAEQLTQIAKLIDDGTIKVVIEKVFPFDEIKAAQELSQQGHVRGKLVLQVE